MEQISPEIGRLLAELLRLQQWAGNEEFSAGRAFGLLHGFETALQQEKTSVISEETQDLVEDLLEEVEAGTQSIDGLAIKSRLHSVRVDETVAAKVMQLCRLQSRFLDGIEKVIAGSGSPFAHLGRREPPWTGAMFYVELVDTSNDASTKMYAVLTPAIPRIGEFVVPQSGSSMEVDAIEYVVVAHEGRGVPILVPHVHLIQELDEDEEGDQEGEEGIADDSEI